MALFSSPPSPEIRQAQKLSREERRIKYTIPTAVGMLEVTLRMMNQNSLNIAPNVSQETMYVPPSTYTPEPSVVAASQEKVAAAHNQHGGYGMPAHQSSDPLVQKARQEVYAASQASGTLAEDPPTLSEKFISANEAQINYHVNTTE